MVKLYLGIRDDVMVNGNWVQTYTVEEGVYNTRSGSIWRGLKARINKAAKAYAGCSICFESFNEFCNWNRMQYGYMDGWELDKDLLSGYFVYSQSTCCLIPSKLNNLMQGVGSWKRGELVGASFFKRDGNWRAYGNDNYKQVHLGYHNSQVSAHNAWRVHKASKLAEFNLSELPDDLQKALQRLIYDLRDLGYEPSPLSNTELRQ